MANKSLGRVWFSLSRETTDDASRVNDDPVGLFSCRANVARFLDIDKLGFTGTIYGKAREYTTARNLTLADGTVLDKSAENTDGKNAGEPIALQRKVGGRSVIIKTGKKIGTKVAGKPQGYHSISFAFPTWATIRVIADSLGEIIPAGKISSDPGENEIQPTFKIAGGGSYGIMQKAAADTSTVANTSVNALKTKIKAKGGDVQEGAG
ncbi:hypothetical protein [Nostoc sp. DSM 114167]|jgi:hypothetical protein|uniref:hypothetical protein n=1 Tax=Nostoc sp. DSM 114167 TaxID=3439050 RepID=UPI004045F543